MYGLVCLSWLFKEEADVNDEMVGSLVRLLMLDVDEVAG